MFAWYDFWVGIFYDRHKSVVYILPVPMIGFKIELNSKNRVVDK